MKKILTFIVVALCAVCVSAQMRIWMDGELKHELDLSQIDSITFVKPVLPVDTVHPEQPDTVQPITPDPEGADVPEGCLNVYEARHICDSIGRGNTTADEYYVKGWIRQLDSRNEEGITNYGNATFYIAATNDGTSDDSLFDAYQVYGKDGKKLYDVNQVQVGDFVVICGKLGNFGGLCETVGRGAAYIYYSTNEYFDPVEDPTNITPDPEGADVPAGTLTVYQARHICDSIGSGKTTSDEYYIKGWISRLHSSNASFITGNYHNAYFFIAPTNDGTTNGFIFEAYRVKGPNKGNITDVSQVQVGDFVVLRCKIQNYYGTAETAVGGYIYYSSNPNLSPSANIDQDAPQTDGQ